jgi:hypothetical protein
MPCDTVTEYRLDLEKVINLETMLKGLVADGHGAVMTTGDYLVISGYTPDHYRFTGRVDKKGKMWIRTDGDERQVVALVNRAYSVQAVKNTAKKFGFKVQQKGNTLKLGR